MNKYNCIVVLGPTASGKTRLACSLAYKLGGEVISADSRQVYKQLNIGTGKDLEEYNVNGKVIPYHLIDVAEPGEQFYLHQFTSALKDAFEKITGHGRLPVICGGTGLYLDALRKDFSFTQVKENETLRNELQELDKDALRLRIKTYPPEFVSHVDLDSAKRMIRGIEVAEHFLEHGRKPAQVELPYKPYYIGIDLAPEQRRTLITMRLEKRIQEGLIAEVESLLTNGISHERLERLGLEYKFVSQYLRKQITEEQLIVQLSTAISQFSKRQMTWFRKMEKEGVHIHWFKHPIDIQALVDSIKKETGF